MKQVDLDKPVIFISMGDPAGIGPEIIINSFLKDKNLFNICTPVVIGSLSILSYYCSKKDLLLPVKDIKNLSINNKINVINIDTDKKIIPGKHDKYCGRLSIKYLEYATKLVLNNNRTAIVTAPVSKETIMSAGINFSGHTEYIAKLSDVKSVAMLMVSKYNKVLLVTRHIPLKNVSKVLSIELITQQIEIVCDTLKKYFKLKTPKIIMCNFNPHQGENGRIGDEEKKIIEPAIIKLNKSGISAKGPIPTYKAFISPSDLIVCYYHDQAMIPLKLLYGLKFVNLTCGLPFIRTSPSHGVAYDIAGKNIADPTSMIDAIKLASQLITNL